MRKNLFLYINIFAVLIMFMGCTTILSKKDNENVLMDIKKGQLTQVKSVEKFSDINGFKIENGKFQFSGIKNDKWGFYDLDLRNYNIKQRYSKIGEYDVFIPLNGNGAIYIDLDGNLFIRKNSKDRKIDEEVYGSYSPNILVSQDQKCILYTKGERDDASLYRYMLDEDTPIRIKEKISTDAFFTFSYTTQWSNENHYFIFNNREIYDNNGELYEVINATTTKWSPNDEMIAFIKEPENLKDQEIYIGDEQSYIGTEFAIYNIKDKSTETIYKNNAGLIDAMDSIQWANDSSLVGLSVGKINKTSSGQLENIDYEKVFTYSFKNKISKEVGDIPYNFYEVLFGTYIYGSSIGKRDIVEVVQIFENTRKIFSKPVILNSIDMFIISHKNDAFLINGRQLIKLSEKGDSKIIMDLPWDISDMYFDAATQQLIIINKDYFLFVIKL